MANEAKTMNLFRELLRQRGYYDDPTICVEEQASDNKKVQKLLKCASKSGLGKGYPDFIITSSKYPNLIIVVECKAEISRQKSATVDNFKDYAVDGALLYASFLAKEYDVIAIGTPTWWYTMAPAVKTFIAENDFSDKTVVALSTNSGWPGNVTADIEDACAGASSGPALEVQFDSTGGDRQQTPQAVIDAWIEQVRALL